MKIKTNCDQCNVEIIRYSGKIKKHVFCSIKCKSEWQKQNQRWSEERKKKWGEKIKGENNPNYNKKWPIEKKKALSKKVKQRFEDNPEYRIIVGNSNRGIKFSKERIEKMHGNRTHESYVHHPTEETKKIIGIKSKEKFTIEYLNKLRIKMENQGKWIPLSEKGDYIFYRDISDWVEKMFDIVESNVLSLGVWNVKTNRNGLVRDHKYSRWDGYINKVFPEIMRHPANCQIITHSDNAKKWKKSSISLEELFNTIKGWNKPWKEQDKCIDLIIKYNKNKRYNKKQYMKEYYEHILNRRHTFLS